MLKNLPYFKKMSLFKEKYGKLFSSKRFLPNHKKIEIEITTNCNLKCFNCNRSCRQAPSSEIMSLGQIKKFVNESLDKNIEWRRINVLGGEPTLHPKLFEILEELKKIKDKTGGEIRLATNGVGEKTKEILTRVPSGVTIANTHKTSVENRFDTYNLAPADDPLLKFADFSKGCIIPSFCGLGLTKYGYYPCGPGAAVDRIFGFNIGRKEIPLPNDNMEKELTVLCKYCGHFKDPSGLQHKFFSTKEEKISKTWKKTYENYQRKRPDLTVY
jgi:hypothetical protein